MTRLQSTGELEEPDPGPRALARDIPRYGRQRHPEPEGEIVEPERRDDSDRVSGQLPSDWRERYAPDQ